MIEVGFIGKTFKGCLYEILEVHNHKKIKIKFLDEFGFEKYTYSKDIKTGKIGNPYAKTVAGVGYLGEGPYTTSYVKDGKKVNHKSYTVWMNMLTRVYKPKNLEEIRPSYKGCSVVPEWHNYQNYAGWYENNYVDGWDVDKDILIKGNKVYGPEFCRFVPRYVNGLFTNLINKTSGLPLGVYRATGNSYSAGIGINRKSTGLGYSKNPQEAHKLWQHAKIEQMYVTLNRYSKEYSVDTRVCCAILKRIWDIKLDLQLNQETLSV